MRRVYGLGDALQKVPLTIDDALRPAGSPGSENHARGLVHAEFRGSPALPHGLRQTAQLDYANRWRDSLDGSKRILSSEDQGWPSILQHLAQPVVWVVGIQDDKGTSR